MGGAHHALGLGSEDEGGKAIAFQPLRHIDRADELAWAAEWIGALLAHEMIVVTPEVKEAVWSALTNLATAPVEQRTLTGLSLLLQAARPAGRRGGKGLCRTLKTRGSATP